MTNEYWNFDRTVNSRSIDIYVKDEEVKYRRGSRCEWETAPKSRLKVGDKWNCPSSLAKKVGENYSRIKMVEAGAPVHVFIDSTYHGSMMREVMRMPLPKPAQVQVKQRQQQRSYSSGGNPPPPPAAARMKLTME